MPEFDNFVKRAVRHHGRKFDPTDLDPKFLPFYETQQRIRVAIWGDMTWQLTGTVRITTGWKPSFLLVRRSNAHGSTTLGPRDVITAVGEMKGQRWIYAPLEAQWWMQPPLDCPLNRCPHVFNDLAELHYHFGWHITTDVNEEMRGLPVLT